MNNMAAAKPDVNARAAIRSEILLAIAMLAIIVVLIFPLPTALLDMLLAFNIGFSILLLLVTLSARNPMDVAIFPSLLLLTTLSRLSLNVATTRLILLNGDAGKIVSTFGDFIVGGQLIVGFVIFVILVVVQFIVITKGAGRISEVNARFTLDSLPGKQMAIDAELNAGSINEKEARKQRQDLARETEFFGAMDGAGKYVRGDSIASIIITVINLVGGVLLGTMNGMSFTAAIEHYSVLTIGDGLVSQIPALIIATTAGLLITKASTNTNLGHEVHSQIFSKRRPLQYAAVVLFVLGVMPGLPFIPFAILATGLLVISLRSQGQRKRDSTEAELNPQSTPPTSPEEESLENFVNSDRIAVEIGSTLIPFVERPGQQGLKDRISRLRDDLTKKYGLWIPRVRIRDTLSLSREAYRISINGRMVAEGEIFVDEFLAIRAQNSQMQLTGKATRDPAFGLDAVWISQSEKRRAEFGGYTVVDALTVLTTHLGEVLRAHSHELLGREDLRRMLDKLKETAPTIVAELKPELIRPAVLRRMLALLLEERVPINNLEIILESVAQHAERIKEPEVLAETVRVDIGAILCEPFRDANGHARVIVLDPRLESKLLESLVEGRLALAQTPLENLISVFRSEWEKAILKEEPAAVLVDGSLRRALRAAVRRSLRELTFLSYSEVPTYLMIEPIALISASHVFGADQFSFQGETPLRDAPGQDSTGNASNRSAKHQPGNTANVFRTVGIDNAA